MATFTDRMRSAWNAFVSQEEQQPYAPVPGSYTMGGYSSIAPSRTRLRISNERTIISSIYTRMAIDISTVEIRHTRHDDTDRYLEDIKSGLNDCLTVDANLDQAASAIRLDMALSLFDKGVIAIVPVDTTINPNISGGYDVKSLRVGEITQWYPAHVRVNLYNERKGYRQEILLEKRNVAIVENPLYSVMNEPNSTLQRLIRKLNLLDSVDEASSSGKLDLIIQLPYVVKSEARRQQANERRKEIEFQLRGSQYGIAYTDGTEKITQLNRPTENNLLEQITTLTNLLYVQLGLTPEVMNGTADEAAMLNYNNRTVEPIIRAITEEMARKFLTKTARSQGQTIDYFRNPFKLVPMAQMAEMVDKFTRNEVLTSNEIRQYIGVKPSTDPKADKLINSNMPQGDTGVQIPGVPTPDSTTPAPVAPATPDTAPTDTSSFDAIGDAVNSAFTSMGATPPTGVVLAPPPGLGEMDPDVTLSSLDELDSAIDQTFSGLGL